MCIRDRYSPAVCFVDPSASRSAWKLPARLAASTRYAVSRMYLDALDAGPPKTSTHFFVA
eukprot:209925-Pleurochrysis_carterae.AAC.1